MGRFMRMFERRCVQVLANGHAGQSFRLACLPGRNPGGCPPRLLRDRPADEPHGWRKSAREWGMGYMLCMGSNSVDGGKGYEGLMAEGLPLVAKGPPLGRGGMGGENICGGSACRVARV